MEKTAQSTISRCGLLNREDRVVVGISGGPDSVALLAYLHGIADSLDLTLYAAHLNHKIRGEESDQDEAFVVDLCGELDIPLKSGSIDVPAVAAARGVGIEEAARDERRKMLLRAAEVYGANRIALGHTADDQAETVLMNLFRGAGILGLAGIRPIQDDLWIRPLLHCTRDQILDYLRRHGLTYRTDLSNYDTSYLRNRVRHDLLPLLDREYRTGISATLARNADLLADDADYLQAIAAETLAKIMAQGNSPQPNSESDPGHLPCAITERIEIPLSDLRALHPSLARRVVLQAIAQVRGSLVDVEIRHVAAVLDSDRAYGLTLPGGDVTVQSDGERLIVAKQTARPQATPEYVEYAIPIPGTVIAPELGVAISAEVVPVAEAPAPGGDRNQAILDLVSISGCVVVRSRRQGDRIRPIGLGGSKSISDLLTDAKIPSPIRSTIPIIADGEKILWVVGLAVSDEAKVGPNTGQALILTAEPVNGDLRI